ncbi:anhydro-N-acetylmuramic acid kinase [Sinimarinibacterium sp. CAU 1509]|uniref:anhydro-N-acetylmuramic acid kinase n=1 Tax=Sinimarinibacterium sp. CAU 1509 TaxID=2562283 RepID=UPI0010AB9EAA|nr:anhydro-N-acetylmuramic acid kinase [Sinimarinibacterium sp. CAU 1509]TJY64861.1 anhydro-N-acetylmuramic acid kinase [Sinimarinibacterium sp. CAU 1509]
MRSEFQRCIGLMSGTSMDAVDAALCRFDSSGKLLEIESTCSLEYGSKLRAALLRIQLDPDHLLSLRTMADLDQQIAGAFAECAATLIAQCSLSPADILVIGSHGQTVFHDALNLGNSLQLGNPSLIAARCGVPVVADFRRADIAAGGQGAPLVPAFHLDQFGSRAPCAVLNIGGIANLTLLDGESVTGFDTGPGNGLMDEWIQVHRAEPFDRGGSWAAQGKVVEALVTACLNDPYFASAPPKSTGRDQFNLAWLRRRYPALDQLPAVDVQRSLCELTARSISNSLLSAASGVSRIYVCGGGTANILLLESLRRHLPGTRVETTQAAGLDPLWVEASAFAWLAWRTAHGRAGNLTSVTGAGREVVLGGVFRP